MSSLDNGNNRNDISNSVKLLHGNEYIVSIANFDFTFESKNPFIFIQILSNISKYIIISFQLSIRLIRNGFVTNFSLIAKMSYVNNCFKFYFRIRQETIWSYSTKGWHRYKESNTAYSRTLYFVTKRRRCSLEEKTMYTQRLSMRREHLIILRYAIILMKGPDATHIRRIIFGHSEPRGGYRPPVFFSAAFSVRSRLCYKVFRWLKYG